MFLPNYKAIFRLIFEQV